MNTFKKIFKSIILVTTLLSLLITSTNVSQAYSEQHSRIDSTFRARKISMMDGNGGYWNLSSFVDKHYNTPLTKNSGTFYYKYDRAYSLQKDISQHRGPGWKLFYRGSRIATLNPQGYVIAN